MEIVGGVRRLRMWNDLFGKKLPRAYFGFQSNTEYGVDCPTVNRKRHAAATWQLCLHFVFIANECPKTLKPGNNVLKVGVKKMRSVPVHSNASFGHLIEGISGD